MPAGEFKYKNKAGQTLHFLFNLNLLYANCSLGPLSPILTRIKI